MTKVKICGLMTGPNIEAVNQYKPDYAGFVFAPGRHQITFQQSSRLRKKLDPAIESVGVFVNESAATIINLFKAKIITIAQLHGYGDQSMISKLQSSGLTVIRVFVNEPIDNSLTADFSMIDSGAGSGKLLDLTTIKPNHKIFLAGGLTPENVKSAINLIHPFAVDVSSGVETNGHKDFEKINNFITQAKGAI
ncbi:phosphoribosylanthranilate isomerase [Lentilactobacillus sp. SPB1-3]|uniref:Phosphoribosylanthranilate isomerase n=1 Tax=Lentilactobacillus terminaliae TaxID=3003483 RepID=A0ACD5DEC7_9LACO|nr:phosphoribosylanthranilate isomerase [Lentilactobacillus sp. SPB1-3]MCZ0976259.1 phosphoribosylanthranilate isomerase [Lentilactobacillus sp. SPB1-3]